MLSVEQALEKILSYVTVLEAEEKPILDSLGQVLAEDVYAAVDVPPLDNSAMDGFAVRSADTRGAGAKSPRVLRVIDTVGAGSLSQHEVKLGTAIRIMTGAAMPAGADSVVKFEDTDAQLKGTSDKVSILAEATPGLNVRRAGESISRGSLLLKQGTIIRPPEVGVLASIGRARVKVVRRPTVAVLITGEELVDVGQPLTAGKIYDSNTYSVAAQVSYAGGIPKILGVAKDNEGSLVASLRRGLDADMVITTGGVSLGDYDIVKDVLAREGGMVFWSVRMKPGKPLAVGRIKGAKKDILHIGLPGNPVSVMVTFELFARPALLKMMGKSDLSRPTIEAVLEETVVNEDARRFYARAILEKCNGRYFARLTGAQGSGILTSMTAANGLVIVPEDKPRVEKGDLVQVMLLDWGKEC